MCGKTRTTKGITMKRVPILKKDYPENFNKVAKYISKNWTNDKLSLEDARQKLAVWIGYNSIYELENSFADKIPNLIDVNSLIYSIQNKMSESFKKETKEITNYDYSHIYSIWKYYKENTFKKIPFYLLSALDKSRTDVFSGIYDKVAERMSLFIQNYRYGGYYGLFTTYADRIEDIDSAIDYDKTTNLLNFFDEYECFPYGRGSSHLSVITQISERVEKYFDEKGRWKLRVLNEEGYELEYFDVLDILLSWFKEDGKGSSGTPFYVIDNRKDTHWLFNSLQNAIKELEENNYKRVEIIEEVEETNDSNNGMTNKSERAYFIDEFSNFGGAFSEGMQKLWEMGSGLKRPVSKEDETGYSYMDGKPILITDRFKTIENKIYNIGTKPNNEYYAYLEEEPLKVFDLAEFDKKAIQLFYATQSL